MNSASEVLSCFRRPTRFRNFAQENSRSEEHTSELQSRRDLVCRLRLEKKDRRGERRRRPRLELDLLHAVLSHAGGNWHRARLRQVELPCPRASRLSAPPRSGACCPCRS